MDSKFVPAQFRSAVVVVLIVAVTSVAPFQARAQVVPLDPAKVPRIGNVDERFVSYNIEMAEVTGGSFWKPYHSRNSAAEPTQPLQYISVQWLGSSTARFVRSSRFVFRCGKFGWDRA
jgi:hypothetical protein